MELVQAGGAKEDKKALKLAKRRLGTHRRGMRKREDLRQVVRAMRHKA
jgi:large subunit ribosomal protein L36e